MTDGIRSIVGRHINDTEAVGDNYIASFAQQRIIAEACDAAVEKRGDNGDRLTMTMGTK